MLDGQTEGEPGARDPVAHHHDVLHRFPIHEVDERPVCPIRPPLFTQADAVWRRRGGRRASCDREYNGRGNPDRSGRPPIARHPVFTPS